jgi:hypothetical protein
MVIKEIIIMSPEENSNITITNPVDKNHFILTIVCIDFGFIIVSV